jgi:uncharacterized membrane protein
MNARLARTAFAIASVLVASIVVGGMIVFVGALAYRWISDAGFPALAVTCLVAGSLIVGALIALLGQLALREAFQRSQTRSTQTPEHMIVGELMKAVDANPTKLVMASLGVGLALGLSPRLRRMVYRSLVG